MEQKVSFQEYIKSTEFCFIKISAKTFCHNPKYGLDRVAIPYIQSFIKMYKTCEFETEVTLDNLSSVTFNLDKYYSRYLNTEVFPQNHYHCHKCSYYHDVFCLYNSRCIMISSKSQNMTLFIYSLIRHSNKCLVYFDFFRQH